MTVSGQNPIPSPEEVDAAKTANGRHAGARPAVQEGVGMSMCAVCNRYEPITDEQAREKGWVTHLVVVSGDGQRRRVISDKGQICPECVALFPEVNEDARTV